MLAAQPGPSPPEPAAPATDRDVEVLKTLLADRDITCSACGYNLRGLAEPACPECNEPLALPESLGAHGGFGAGSMAVWVFPLTVDVVFLLLSIDELSPGLGMMWGGLAAMAIIPLVFSFAFAGRRVSLGARRRYWMYSRLAISAHAVGLLVFVMMVMN